MRADTITLPSRILIVVVCLLAGRLPGRAQAPADTASYALSKVSFRGLGGTVLAKTSQTLLVEARYPTRDSTRLQQLWFDAHMRLRRQTTLALRGKNLRPEVTQPLGSGVLVQLASRDTLRLLALDTAGRVVAQLRQPLPPHRGQYELRTLELPQLKGLLMAQQWRNDSCLLIYRNPDLTVRWQQPLLPKGKLTKFAADSTHLWLIVTRYRGYRHPTNTALCLDVATGTLLSRTQLGPTASKNQRVPSVVSIGADHSLLVAGHAYRGRAVNTHHSGDLFVARLGPTGQVLSEVQLPFKKVPRQQGARSRRVAWLALQGAADGSVRLAGETYTTTPALSCYLRIMFSVGLLGFDVLRPKDVVSLRLTPGGRVEQLRITPLPHDRGSFVWGTYASPLGMEQLASDARGFRTRGLAADSATLVLRSPQQVQALDLRSGQLALLRPAPPRGQSEVLYVGQDCALLVEARLFQGTLRLIRVKYPTGK